jgi:hypothetical protein
MSGPVRNSERTPRALVYRFGFATTSTLWLGAFSYAVSVPGWSVRMIEFVVLPGAIILGVVAIIRSVRAMTKPGTRVTLRSIVPLAIAVLFCVFGVPRYLAFAVTKGAMETDIRKALKDPQTPMKTAGPYRVRKALLRHGGLVFEVSGTRWSLLGIKQPPRGYAWGPNFGYCSDGGILYRHITGDWWQWRDATPHGAGFLTWDDQNSTSIPIHPGERCTPA